MTDALHRCEGMSSERWEEPSSRARPEETGLEKQQGEVEEKEEVYVPCQDRQLVGSLTVEEELPKRCLSPDHSGRQEVISKGRAEGAGREKTQKKRMFSRFKNSRRRKESGVWREKSGVNYLQICKTHFSHINLHTHALIIIFYLVFKGDGKSSGVTM